MIIEPVTFRTVGAYQILRKYDSHHAQLRVLVCEGPSLLAWVGAFRHEPFTTRERWLLDQLVTPLRDRLTLERRLDITKSCEPATTSVGTPIEASRGLTS